MRTLSEVRENNKKNSKFAYDVSGVSTELVDAQRAFFDKCVKHQSDTMYRKYLTDKDK